MCYIIRCASLKDLKCLFDIETKTFDPSLYLLITQRQYRYLLTKANAEIWVLEIEKQIIASAVILYRKHSNYGRLYSISVTPEYQKQGYAQKLLEYIENYIKNKIPKSLKGIRQEIRLDNQKLLNKYINNGYKIIGQSDNYYPDGQSCLKLQKEFSL